MDGYVADWSRDYFIDKYARSFIKRMKKEDKNKYIYNSIKKKLELMSNAEVEDEIKSYDPNIILGEID